MNDGSLLIFLAGYDAGPFQVIPADSHYAEIIYVDVNGFKNLIL